MLHIMDLQTFCGYCGLFHGPHVEKQQFSGISHSINYPEMYVAYTQFTNVAASPEVPPDRLRDGDQSFTLNVSVGIET